MIKHFQTYNLHFGGYNPQFDLYIKVLIIHF